MIESRLVLGFYKKNWIEKYKKNEIKPSDIIKIIKLGQRIFIGTGCSEPQALTREIVKHQSNIADCQIIHFLTIGETQYFSDYEQSQFRHNALFIGKTMRDAISNGSADYTPIKLSDIQLLFRSGRNHIDVVLIQVSPPDESGTVSIFFDLNRPK